MAVLKFKDGNGMWQSIPAIKGDTGDTGVYVGPNEPENPEKDIWVNPEDGADLIDLDWQALQSAVTDSQLAKTGSEAARDTAIAQAALAQGYAAQLAAGTASPAGTYANLAALTSANPDHGKIYITLDDGRWCYHNGSAWVAGGVYQTLMGVDDTLTQAGEAADAKVTGDKVGELKSALKRNANSDKLLGEENKIDLLSGIDFAQGNLSSGQDSSSISPTRIRSGVMTIPDYTDWIQIDADGTYTVSISEFKTVEGSYVFSKQSFSNGSPYLGSQLYKVEVDTTAIRVVIKNADANLKPDESSHIRLYIGSELSMNHDFDRLENGFVTFAEENRLDLLVGIAFTNGNFNLSGEDAGPESLIRIKSEMIQIPSGIDNLDIQTGALKIQLVEYSYSEGTYTMIKSTADITTRTFGISLNCAGIRIVAKKTEDATITPSDASVIKIYAIKATRDPIYSVEGSSTDNILDISEPFTNFRITNNPPYFVSNTSNARIAKPIPVKGLKVIHLHGPVHNFVNSRWIAFTKDTSRSADSVICVWQGLNSSDTDATIEVPPGAEWLYITLGFKSSDYVGTTASAGRYSTTESYDGDKEAGLMLNGAITTAESLITPDYVKCENQRVYKEICQYSVGMSGNAMYNRANILFFTDSHIDYANPNANWENVLETIKFANGSPVRFDAVINGGDTITPFDVNAKEGQIAKFMKFFNAMKKLQYPFIYVKGNHDLNDWRNTPENTFDDQDWSDMWFDYAESKYGIVRQTKASGKKSTWHYYDIDDYKIRVIAVDVQDTDKTKTDANGNVFYYGGKAWYISQEQMSWIISTALNFDDKDDLGWGVIIATHQTKTYGDATGESPAFENAIQKLANVLVAFNTQSTYSNTFTFETDSFFDLTISADFTRYANGAKKPHVICWLIGHEHQDHYYLYNGINIILTLCGGALTYSLRDVARINNSATQNSFDVLSIDTKERKIRLIRYGAGKNCYGVGGDRFIPDGLSY